MFQHAEEDVKLMKTAIYRLVTTSGSKRYKTLLPELVRGLNNRYMPILGMAPSQVTVDNQDTVFHRRYDKVFEELDVRSKFKVGDRVRIALNKKAFDKSYTQNFSQEIYVVRQVTMAVPVHSYKLSDLQGGAIARSWFAASLTLSGD